MNGVGVRDVTQDCRRCRSSLAPLVGLGECSELLFEPFAVRSQKVVLLLQLAQQAL